MSRVESVSPGAIVWEDGLIAYAGSADDVPSTSGLEELPGTCVVPGFVDCHTHLPFFGWRADEYEARLAGRSYKELHGEGGITRSADMLAEAADAEVLRFCAELADEMAAHGTTALELKTGYGLSVGAELRQARLARELAASIRQSCVVTLLCHAVPSGEERSSWVRTFTEELLPAAAGEGLIDSVDIYVEDIAFTVDDLRAVSEAAAAAGLPARCHADQLGASGAAQAAAAAGVRSADHLNHADGEGIAALASASGTVGVLLPGSTLMLHEDPAPARRLVDSGAAVAVATDLNPGTSPVTSMPEAIALACSMYRLTPLEALTAATANPAWVLGLHEGLGTLEIDKRADFLVLDSEDFVSVPYRPGHNPVLRTYIAGVSEALP